jgi:hypothetical protein
MTDPLYPLNPCKDRYRTDSRSQETIYQNPLIIMPKVKIEHIDALSKGKKSGIKLGSRSVPHHLYLYEREEYERALKR